MALMALRICIATAMVLLPITVDAAGFSFSLLPAASGARCLDGSLYGVATCISSSNPGGNWTVNFQGGGYCGNMNSSMVPGTPPWAEGTGNCVTRAATALGSSASWAAAAASMNCNPDVNGNTAFLMYCDGASFTGYREAPLPVPGNASAAPVWIRGIRNLDATLDHLLPLGLAQASTLVVTGSSAGGLAVYYHLDHIAARMAAVNPATRVVGKPVCGFFIDSPNENAAYPASATFSEQVNEVYTLHNSSGTVNQACQDAYGPAQAFKCFMPGYGAAFVRTPWFALQSRFDRVQLGSEGLLLECMIAGNPNCTAAEVASIHAYGPFFMQSFSKLMRVAETKNGGFVDACIIHGSTNSSIDGVTNNEAFEAWLSGGQQWFVATCNGSESAGPCDPSPVCARY